MEKFSQLFDGNFLQKLRKNNRVEVFQRATVRSRIEFRDFLKCEKFFEFFGVSVKTSKLNQSRARKIHFTVLHTCSILLIFLTTFSCIKFALEKNLEYSVENFVSLAGALNIFVRVFYIFFYRQNLLAEVIEDLNEHFPHRGLDQHFTSVGKYFKELKVISWISFLTYGMTVLQYTCFMVEGKIYGLIMSQDFPWVHINNLWMPFDTTSIFVYLPLFAVELWYTLVYIMILLCLDLLYAGLMAILSMEFEDLAMKISEVQNAEELKQLLKIHQDLIEIAGKLEEIFSPLMLVNVFTTITGACIGAFLGVIGVNLFFLLRFGTILFLGFNHAFVHCHYAQKLTDTSSSIAFAAYCTPWPESDLKFRKLVLIMMIRAQDGEELTAWKFFGVSMETYYWIIDTSYSFYSFLMGVHGANA